MNKIEKEFLGKLLDEDGIIKVPEYANNIKIDVGLSHTAVNSILWINNPNLSDRHIFAFEPLFFLNPFNGIDPTRYTLIRAGLDDIPAGIQTEMFVCGEDPGRSSLYVPNTFSPIRKDISFMLPFRLFLEKLPWKRFDFIEHLKTDTQGNDLRILQNAGDYLKKVVYLEVEATCYDNEYSFYPKKEETQEFLESMGFELIKEKKIDQTYLNKRFKSIANSLDCSRVP
jgi:hypothetical protein